MPKVSEKYIDDKKTEIIEAAYRVCTRKPITSVVMNDVISETGFSHGAIYRYYSDLDEVLRDLVIKINSEHSLDSRLDAILNEAGTDGWKDTVRNVFRLLSDHMIECGTDVMKISIYGDMLAMSEPERVSKIAGNLEKNAQSPLLHLVQKLEAYMKRTVTEKSLKGIKTVEELIQFIVTGYSGIQTGYVLSGSSENRYRPEDMFSVLAESVILLMEGK